MAGGGQRSTPPPTYGVSVGLLQRCCNRLIIVLSARRTVGGGTGDRICKYPLVNPAWFFLVWIRRSDSAHHYDHGRVSTLRILFSLRQQ